MNALVIGRGGREHALVWKLAQSPRIERLYALPGSDGMSRFAQNIPVDPTDVEKIVDFALGAYVDLVVVGPEESLAAGVTDACRAHGIPVFGPSHAASKIELSKAFANRLMREAGIPTAPFRIFHSHNDAHAYVTALDGPCVVKADGLAYGKGTYVCRTRKEAQDALHAIMVERVHEAAGDIVVVEDKLPGEELSVHVFCDGKTYDLAPFVQDHKPIGEHDAGPNTGGMGAIVPVPWAGADMKYHVAQRIVSPALEALARYGYPYSGLLYPGIKGRGTVEFNARFGDPETQVLMLLLKTSLLDVLLACANGTLADLTIEWHSGYAACIVLASGGYPGPYEKGFPITGLGDAERVPGVVVFHSGTKWRRGWMTNGGRVLSVTAVGATLAEALERANEAAEIIQFEGKQFRRDIGHRALAHSE